MNKDKNKVDLILKREEYILIFQKYQHILTKVQFQIMQLYYVEDLSISEIAAIVATTRSAVHDTLKKARKKLEPFLKID